ncbi:hypothetical protein CL618_00705 [archaeon]|nr:hypothetical protein [archaeon]|tara:strand:+ start:3692 stop:4042 length:351 start_codon:yes stop_codon:yes gene_type:complete
MTKNQRSKRYRTEQDHQEQEPYNSINFLPQPIDITIDQETYQATLKQDERNNRWEVSYKDITISGNTQSEAIKKFKTARILNMRDSEDLGRVLRKIIHLIEPITIDSLCNISQQSL